MASSSAVDGKRKQFGTRYLTDDSDVFKHNAWDDVTWDETLENDARDKVKKNSDSRVSAEMQDKYEHSGNQFWDSFYGIHQNKFFKDRHWLFTEFPELLSNSSSENASSSSQSDSPVELINQKMGELNTEDKEITPRSANLFPGANANFRIFEIGCGVGNTIYPILETNIDPGLFVYGCDFSETAISLVKQHALYNEQRCHAFVCNVSNHELKLPFPEESIDVVILIFVLSALNPDKMQNVIFNIVKYLKPGGLILLRDYGRYDMAQLRFKTGHCLAENFYVRGDGTRVYFFTQDELHTLFESAGLVKDQNLIDRRLQLNRGKLIKMYRVWIQCKYRKPMKTNQN